MDVALIRQNQRVGVAAIVYLVVEDSLLILVQGLQAGRLELAAEAHRLALIQHADLRWIDVYLLNQLRLAFEKVDFENEDFADL